MKRLIKTILIISIALIGAGVLSVSETLAQNNNLVVEFEKTPLFNETNFLPGEGVSRWVKVSNNSGQIQRIAVQPLNITDPNRLGDVLNLVIKEGGVTRYDNSLSSFFTSGENYLSELATGATTQYDFIVSFYSGAQNSFQGETLGFDILIGFQGTEGGILPGAGSTSGGYGGGGGGGGGGLFPPGLTIQNESERTVSGNSVTITWSTSYFSTSQVIYDTVSGKFDLSAGPDNYGYAYLKEGDDSGLEKITGHSVTVTGLTPGTTYYYRCVSHGSLAIGEERSFTALKETVEGGLSGEQINSEGISFGGETISAQSGEKENVLLSEKTTGAEESFNGSVEIKTNVQGLEENKSFLEKIGNLAASLFLGFSNKWPLFIALMILISAVLAFILLFKKKRND